MASPAHGEVARLASFQPEPNQDDLDRTLRGEGRGEKKIHGGAIIEGHPSSGHGDAGGHATEHGGGMASIFSHMPPLPKWMFWFAIITAYVTPFYMMRCWWMTFMGKPRDEHVHEHAHEIPLMYVPLVVLAVGTFWVSYWLFRPLIADGAPAATDAAMVMGTRYSRPS